MEYDLINSKRKIKEIYVSGNLYEMYSYKHGIYLVKNKNITGGHHNNIRDCINWIYDYSEFVIGFLE